MANEKKMEEQIKDIACSTSLKSFQRNRYFYGKLLTVRDFEDEQRYFVEKQRLINRLIHGEGVVCGLKVEKVEDKSGFIRITPGVALDCCGREIVVPEPVEIDLSNLEEFGDEETITRWVTIRYSACGKEPVPVYSAESSCEETCCYSRIEEGYKIDVLEQRPEDCESMEDEGVCQIWLELLSEVENKKELSKQLINYWEQCSSFSDKPVILAKLIISKTNDQIKINEIDRTLSDNEGDFNKKLIYSNPRLYRLIKCIGKSLPDWLKKDFPKITDINWPHDGVFKWKIIEYGTAQGGSENSIILKQGSELQECLNEYPIEDFDIVALFYNENNVLESKVKKAKEFESDTSELKIEGKWDNETVPNKNTKYILILNQIRQFAELSRRLKITFDRDISKSTINNKTLNVIAKPYISGQELPFFGNMEVSLINLNVPICYSPPDGKNEVSFSLFKCDQINNELKIAGTLFLIGTAKTYYSTSTYKTSAVIANPLANLINILKNADGLGLRFYIQLKGDFVLDEKDNPLDGNHLKGTLPTGNSCPGGVFESWMDIYIDIKSLKDLFEEFKANIHEYDPYVVAKGFGLTEAHTKDILNTWVRNRIIHYDEGNEKYYPLPEPSKTIIAYDKKFEEYTKNNAEILKETLKKAGIEAIIRSTDDLTERDKKNNDIILIRGKDVKETTIRKLKDVTSRIKWENSKGDREIIKSPYRKNSNIFILGGKDEESVTKAVNNFIKIYK